MCDCVKTKPNLLMEACNKQYIYPWDEMFSFSLHLIPLLSPHKPSLTYDDGT